MRLRVEDVLFGDEIRSRATIVQRKTRSSCAVRSHTTDQGRWIPARKLRIGDPLFPSRVDATRPITTRQYSRLVASWVAWIGLDPLAYALVLTRSQRPHWKHQSGSTSARTYQTREHCSVPRDPGRGCACDSRANRALRSEAARRSRPRQFRYLSLSGRSALSGKCHKQTSRGVARHVPLGSKARPWGGEPCSGTGASGWKSDCAPKAGC
jgi:hypothetical protein